MKITVITMMMVALAICANALFTSTTFIDPYKTFKLGDGEHGSFKATVVNKGKESIGIYTTLLGKQPQRIGILVSGEKKTYAIESNTMVAFENNNPTQAILYIELRGGRNLSMSY
jgi:hypothetical protein